MAGSQLATFHAFAPAFERLQTNRFPVLAQ